MIKNFELTQSSLKDFVNLPREEWTQKWIYKTRPYEYNNSFIYGSILDGLLFEPEVLKKRFVSYKGKDKVSDGLQGVVGLVAKKYNKDIDLDKQILDASREIGFCRTFKDATILAKFKEIKHYIQFCIDNKYKTVVMPKFVKEIQDVANYLIHHEPNSIRQFILANPNEDYRNEFQVTLRAIINGVPCKVIIDILHFDEVNNTVRVIDFKTTYETRMFKESIYKYGYDTQVSFYDEIVRLNADVFKNYTLLPPMNVVVAKRDLDIYIHNYFKPEMEASKNKWIKVVDEIKEYLTHLNENEEK